MSQAPEERTLPGKVEKRTDTFQPDAKDELVFVSQPLGKELEDLGHKYHYDDSAGKGTKVYIVDTGADLDLKVSLRRSSRALMRFTDVLLYSRNLLKGLI